MSNYIEYSCPFCQEYDFDLYSLQLHLERGYCYIYGKVNDRNEIVYPTEEAK